MPKHTRNAESYGAPSKTDRKVPKTATHLRSNRAARMIALRKNKVKHDKKTGEIISGSVLSPSDKHGKGKMARIAPNRGWFGHTKVSHPKVLEKFREELEVKVNDPYSILLKRTGLPYALLEDPKHDSAAPIKNYINYPETYGAKKTRKRPRLQVNSLETMLESAAKRTKTYDEGDRDQQTVVVQLQKQVEFNDKVEEAVFKKGQSNRIWGELYKVIDSSDVILQVLDARDPMGTRSTAIEGYLKREKKFKHLILVLNKCDLIPTWATSRWIGILSREYPTIAFHASITNPFGKGNLIGLIRQFARLHRSNNHSFVSIGLIGYPNVGKSSIINTIKRKKVCRVAPQPGETRVWQYVTLSRGVFLIDCPGVIHNNDDANDSHQAVLKGVVRVERVTEECADYVSTAMKLVDKKVLVDTYGVEEWKDHIDFLTQLAIKRGKLLQGGVPDVNMAARIVLYDWQRARIPWYVRPPFETEEDEAKHMKLPRAEHAKLINAPKKKDKEETDEAHEEEDDDEEEEEEEEESGDEEGGPAEGGAVNGNGVDVKEDSSDEEEEDEEDDDDDDDDDDGYAKAAAAAQPDWA